MAEYMSDMKLKNKKKNEWKMNEFCHLVIKGFHWRGTVTKYNRCYFINLVEGKYFSIRSQNYNSGPVLPLNTSTFYKVKWKVLYISLMFVCEEQRWSHNMVGIKLEEGSL